MTYSLDFRKKVFAIKASEKLSFIDTAKRFNIGVTTLVRWSKRLTPLTKRTKPATKINMDALKKDIETYPDAYQYERAERLGVSTACIWHALKRLNVSYKKNSSASKSGPRQKIYILPTP